tara:strand:+ start:342 stop:518 length:177 start_codon:yes stop_codon:yes gene_type:complete
MIEIIEMLIVVMCLVVVLIVVNVFFWVSYNDGKTPNINDDYYKLKHKADKKEEDGKEV